MAKKHTIDFTNTKESSGINPKHMPRGDYRVKIVNVDETLKDDIPMWRFDMQLADVRSAVYPYYCKLQENQLWKVRNLLIAAGINVPKKKVAVDPNRLVNKEIGVTLEDDEYEGKMKSVVDAVFPVSELEETVEADDDDDDVDDADDTEEDDEELDIDDL